MKRLFTICNNNGNQKKLIKSECSSIKLLQKGNFYFKNPMKKYVLTFFFFHTANNCFKVSDCVAIYSSKGAVIDDDDILEDIDKYEALVILRKDEIFEEKCADKINQGKN